MEPERKDPWDTLTNYLLEHIEELSDEELAIRRVKDSGLAHIVDTIISVLLLREGGKQSSIMIKGASNTGKT